MDSATPSGTSNEALIASEAPSETFLLIKTFPPLVETVGQFMRGPLQDIWEYVYCSTLDDYFLIYVYCIPASVSDVWWESHSYSTSFVCCFFVLDAVICATLVCVASGLCKFSYLICYTYSLCAEQT